MSQIMRNIGVINRCAKLYRSERLRESGLAGNHHTYILNICANPGITQEGLARLIYVDKSSVTRQLTRLECDGFIERVPGKNDRRVLLIYPTEKARAALPEIRRILAEWSGFITEGMSAEDVEHFGELLSKAAARAAEIGNRGRETAETVYIKEKNNDCAKSENE